MAQMPDKKPYETHKTSSIARTGVTEKKKSRPKKARALQTHHG
jgi:hypothetical protein